MENQIKHKCDQHPNPFEGPDKLIFFDPKPEEYGLIIQDGSSITIEYCPWCGKHLPSLRFSSSAGAVRRMVGFQVLEKFFSVYQIFIQEIVKFSGVEDAIDLTEDALKHIGGVYRCFELLKRNKKSLSRYVTSKRHLKEIQEEFLRNI